MKWKDWGKVRVRVLEIVQFYSGSSSGIDDDDALLLLMMIQCNNVVYAMMGIIYWIYCIVQLEKYTTENLKIILYFFTQVVL